MAPAVRRAHLIVVTRLRTLGWLPWILLLAWGTWCGVQEPLDFRRFRVELLYQGIWLMAFALHCQLLGAVRVGGSWAPRVLAALCQLAGLAVAQAVLALAIDLALHRWVELDSAWRSGCYLAASAAGFTIAAPALADGSQSVCRKLFTYAIAAIGLALAAALWCEGWSVRTAAATLLLLFAGGTTNVTGFKK